MKTTAFPHNRSFPEKKITFYLYKKTQKSCVLNEHPFFESLSEPFIGPHVALRNLGQASYAHDGTGRTGQLPVSRGGSQTFSLQSCETPAEQLPRGSVASHPIPFPGSCA